MQVAEGPLAVDLIEHALDGRAVLERVDLSELDGYADDDLTRAMTCWLGSADFETAAKRQLRPALPTPRDLEEIFSIARATPPANATTFFSTVFSPYRVRLQEKQQSGFLTGYYEPRVRGSRRRTPEFSAPILGRPPDLVTFAQGEFPLGPSFTAGRRGADGELTPYPDRAAIENGANAFEPIVWVKDGIEAFMIHVQGSARVVLEDGSELRLTYAGRNGRPYTSIGRLLVDRGRVALPEMSLDVLKSWVREAGQEMGQPGRALMQENQSFIFFEASRIHSADSGPIGGEGIPLTSLRSIAVDRTIWPYGLPFWIQASLPWRTARPEPFRRLMIGQDTGSAIVGPARADLFFGTGHEAGELAGGIRHDAEFFVFLPAGSR